MVGLGAKIHNYPDELSGGEQQRVSVARAFVSHPPLLLADEPTGNLDPETSIGIMQLLYRINRTGTTVVVVTHDREMVDKMRRRVIQLYDGRVIRDQAAGLYATDESTEEFGARVCSELGVDFDDDDDDGRRRRPLGADSMRLGFFLGEAYRALRRNAAPSIAAIVTIAVTVLLVGVLVPVLDASGSKTEDVRNQLELKVFLYNDAGQDEIDALRNRIENDRPRRPGRVHLARRGAHPARGQAPGQEPARPAQLEPAAAGLQRQARRPRQPRVGPGGALAPGRLRASRSRSAPPSTTSSPVIRPSRSARSPAR